MTKKYIRRDIILSARKKQNLIKIWEDIKIMSTEEYLRQIVITTEKMRDDAIWHNINNTSKPNPTGTPGTTTSGSDDSVDIIGPIFKKILGTPKKRIIFYILFCHVGPLIIGGVMFFLNYLFNLGVMETIESIDNVAVNFIEKMNNTIFSFIKSILSPIENLSENIKILILIGILFIFLTVIILVIIKFVKRKGG